MFLRLKIELKLLVSYSFQCFRHKFLMLDSNRNFSFCFAFFRFYTEVNFRLSLWDFFAASKDLWLKIKLLGATSIG